MVIGSGVLVGVKSLIAGVLFSHAFSGELKAVSVVNKAIQDGVAEGGGPRDERVRVAGDPVAGDESGEDGAIDAAWRAPIEVFHACALAQRGELEAGGETFGVALGGFAIDQQSDALLERQGIEIR